MFVLGFPENDPLAVNIAQILGRLDVQVKVVALSLSALDDAAHEQKFLSMLSSLSDRPIIGGFSLGARIAARLCPRVQPKGLLCFGYPFYSPGNPKEREGLDALLKVEVQACIIQGTRDSHGSRAQVTGYPLSAATEVLWLEDGNHRFATRARTGLSQREQRTRLEAATERAISSLRAACS